MPSCQDHGRVGSSDERQCYSGGFSQEGRGCSFTRQDMCSLAQEFIEWAKLNLITITVRYIPRKNNIVADQLSRPDWVLPTEWALLPWVFDAICEVYGWPLIDLFSTRANTKLFFACLQLQIPWHGNKMPFSIIGMISAFMYLPHSFLLDRFCRE